MSIQKLESILRRSYEIRAFYEDTGQDELTLDAGIVLNIHDIYQGIDELPLRQRQALVLCVLYNLKEIDAARIMGIRTSPVGNYKQLALKKLVDRWWSEDQNGADGAGSREA